MKKMKSFKKSKSFKGSALDAGSSNKLSRPMEGGNEPNRADRTLSKLTKTKGGYKPNLVKGGKVK